MTDIHVSMKPANLQEDGTIQEFVQHQELAVSKVISSLQERVNKACFLEITNLLELFFALPVSARRQILMHPHYHHWWFRLSQYYKGGKRQKIEDWLPEIARFLVIPLLQHGYWPEHSIPVRVTPSGQLHFPGHLRHIVLEKSDGGMAHLKQEDDTLIIEYQEREYRVHLGALLDLNSVGTHPLLVQRAVIPNTQIEVDSFDPWTIDFINFLNTVDPTPPLTKGDMQPTILRAKDIQSLNAALMLIGRSWPEMLQEISGYVRLVVPFMSNTAKAAFTNTAWSGAIFLHAEFEDPVHTVERLVHEASHLRLNLIMAQRTLHYHGWNDRVLSPFRAGLRPITGLYHGAFVFTRVAQMMDRAFRVTSDQGYRRRIPPMVDQVIQALETLNHQVRLTPLGQELLDEVATEISMLRGQYPPQAEDSTLALDPYLQEW